MMVKSCPSPLLSFTSLYKLVGNKGRQLHPTWLCLVLHLRDTEIRLHQANMLATGRDKSGENFSIKISQFYILLSGKCFGRLRKRCVSLLQWRIVRAKCPQRRPRRRCRTHQLNPKQFKGISRFGGAYLSPSNSLSPPKISSVAAGQEFSFSIP